MNLKEACRYANFLARKFNTTNDFLFSSENFIKTTTPHKCPGGKKVEVSELNKLDSTIEISDVPALILDIVEEKAKLETAIAEAKQTTNVDYVLDNKKKLTIDSAISYNKSLRELINNLNRIISAKLRNTKSTGTDYILNNDGNQVPFIYPIETTQELTFDRDELIKINKKLNKLTDLISKKIDQAMLVECVSFEPKFDMYDIT
jgi:hypothetical protein